MRSRYSAFALGLGAYLASSAVKQEGWAESAAWARTVTWLSLEVVDAASPGVVEFVARYLEGDAVHALRERSTFVQVDGRWRYEGGAPVEYVTRVSRNEPCPCGSGKKFKQCHR
jgi:SEC-C motif-containing protein